MLNGPCFVWTSGEILIHFTALYESGSFLLLLTFCNLILFCFKLVRFHTYISFFSCISFFSLLFYRQNIQFRFVSTLAKQIFFLFRYYKYRVLQYHTVNLLIFKVQYNIEREDIKLKLFSVIWWKWYLTLPKTQDVVAKCSMRGCLNIVDISSSAPF